jgi:hypothetical protein
MRWGLVQLLRGRGPGGAERKSVEKPERDRAPRVRQESVVHDAQRVPGDREQQRVDCAQSVDDALRVEARRKHAGSSDAVSHKMANQ